MGTYSLNTAVKTTWREHVTIHPAAEAFPLLSDTELQELADDIKANGIKAPIQIRQAEDNVIYLVDGRNRLDACELLGWQVVTIEGKWGGHIKPFLEYKRRNHNEIRAEIVSANIMRRHLTQRQRAELVIQLLGDQLATEAKESQLSRLKQGDETPVGTMMTPTGRVRDKIATIAKVSPSTAQRALRTHKNAAPVRRKPKPELPFESRVVKRFARWMDFYPGARHREVYKIIHEFTTR